MTTKPRLIFFGNEQLATGTDYPPFLLPALIDAGWDVAALVLRQDQVRSRSKRIPAVVDIAKSHRIPVFTEKLADLKEKIGELKPSLGILAAYGRIIPQDILDLFPAGIINIHPSLLPKYRGPTPVESVILNGESQTGISVIKLVEQMDAGPILAQATLALDGTETKPLLAQKLAKMGADLLIDSLPSVLDGSLKPSLQSEDQASYTKLISKEDGQLDWRLPARQIERQIRAFVGWPGSYTKIWGKDVTLTKVHLIAGATRKAAGEVETIKPEGLLLLYAADGCIAIERLKPAGKKEMSAAEFIRGYKPRVA